MSEKNNIFENDLLMRSILEGGQEEVPARVWDAVADRLDKVEAAGRKKTVTLWWRRAGIATAAMAAAVASVLVLNRPQDVDMVPKAENDDMIAVAEPVAVEDETVVSRTSGAGLIAYVPNAVKSQPETMVMMAEDVKEEAVEEMIVAEEAEVEEMVGETEASAAETVVRKEEAAVSKEEAAPAKEYFPAVWEDEEEVSRVRTSVVVSGITGTSGSQGNRHSGIYKAPGLILAPTQTGIKDKDLGSSFGLPVSVGAGVRFEFTPKWSLGVGLNYTYLTRTFNGTYTHVNEAGSIDNLITSDIRNSQHFIGIPVNAYFNILSSNNINFYAYVGGAVEKCVSDKYLILTNKITHKESVNGVQASANVGVGLEFMLGQKVGLYLDPSLRYYFDCKQPKSIRTVQPLILGFELGFRFKL